MGGPGAQQSAFDGNWLPLALCVYGVAISAHMLTGATDPGWATDASTVHSGTPALSDAGRPDCINTRLNIRCLWSGFLEHTRGTFSTNFVCWLLFLVDGMVDRRVASGGLERSWGIRGGPRVSLTHTQISSCTWGYFDVFEAHSRRVIGVF